MMQRSRHTWKMTSEFFNFWSCHRPAMYLLEGEGAPGSILDAPGAF